MTRIIGGDAKGRRIEAPTGQDTRPTSDRVREALFSAVESWAGGWEEIRFLDLYAGSGAVGLEAWSRGATAVTLVEQDRRTADLIRNNARLIGCTTADVRAGAVSTVLAAAPTVPYDVVFCDPPYPMSNEDVEADLAALVGNGWLVDDPLVVVERGRRSREFRWPAPLVEYRQRKYGETVLWYGHAADPAPTDSTPADSTPADPDPQED